MPSNLKFAFKLIFKYGSKGRWRLIQCSPEESGRIVAIENMHFSFEIKLKSERSSLEEPLETESLAEVQFVIDSCRFVSQSNYLNNSNKDCDCLMLACFIREQSTADATFTRLENKVWFENSAECVGKLLDSLS